jgi:hypothetical protein
VYLGAILHYFEAKYNLNLPLFPGVYGATPPAKKAPFFRNGGKGLNRPLTYTFFRLLPLRIYNRSLRFGFCQFDTASN